MKKLFYLLIGLLLILPSTIEADMSSPMVIKYKASVTNPNGIDEYKLDEQYNYVKTGKKIPYGTVFEIEFDDFTCANEACETFVSVKDLTSTLKEYKVEKDKLGEYVNAVAYKDLDIKKGPASAYESTGTIIKAGTKISIAKVDGNDEFNPWYYVEYNGVKGYVDSYSETILFNFYEKELMASGEINIIDPNTKKTLKTLEPTTKFKAKHGYFDAWSQYEYIEYDGIKGLIQEETIIIKRDKAEIKTLDEIKVNSIAFEYLTSNTDKTIVTIKENESFTSEYIYYDKSGAIYVYYEKDNIKGFAYTNNYDVNDNETIYTLSKNKEFTVNPKGEDNKEETNKDEEKTITKPKKDYTLYICIGAGILVSIIAIIIIVSINQKKKEPEL